MVSTERHRVSVLLHLSKSRVEFDMLERLHAHIEAEIRRSSERIETARSSGDEGYLNAVIDAECEHAEELLGLAFIVAQNFIMSVRARFAALAKACRRDLSQPLTFLRDPNACGILDMADAMPNGSKYTEVEAINAVANYWKHQMEWTTHLEERGEYRVLEWGNAGKAGVMRTIEIAKSLGMSAASTGNLRTAAAALGVDTFHDLSPIRMKLSRWVALLHERARGEIAEA